MNVVHSACNFDLVEMEVTEQCDFGRIAYYINNGHDGMVMGFIEFHTEIKQWAIEARPGFAFTLGFITKVYEAVMAKRHTMSIPK